MASEKLLFNRGPAHENILKLVDQHFASTLDMSQTAVLSASFPCCVMAFCCLAIRGEIAAAEPFATTVSGPRLSQQLDQPMTASWSNLPFRDAMTSLADTQRIAVVIDRRIDADALFSLTISGEPLRQAIARIAQRKGIGSTLLGPVVYFGPQDAAQVLKTLAALRRDDVGRLPAGARKPLTQSRPLVWKDLDEPKQLIAELAKEAHIAVRNLDHVPHDLWRAGRVPALPWVDRLTLLLVQFGLTFDVSADGRSVTIVPIPERVEIERNYAGGEQPGERAKKLATQIPQAMVTVEGDKIVVVGRMEDHEDITQLLSGRRVHTSHVKAGKDVYKLNVERLPLDKVLSQLGAMLKLDLKLDRDAIQTAGIKLDQLITFHVENASLDELLTAALEGTGLHYEREDTTVTIGPR